MHIYISIQYICIYIYLYIYIYIHIHIHTHTQTYTDIGSEQAGLLARHANITNSHNFKIMWRIATWGPTSLCVQGLPLFFLTKVLLHYKFSHNFKKLWRIASLVPFLPCGGTPFPLGVPPLCVCNVCPCVLQCVAVCCSVLQCVAVCCSVLQCVAVCCSELQCVAVHCSVLPCA